MFFIFAVIFQVLVAQIGNVLGLSDVDNGLDDYRSTSSLTYDQFRFYLSKEVRTLLKYTSSTHCTT